MLSRFYKIPLLLVFLCVSSTFSSMANAVEINYQSAYVGPHTFNLNTAQPWAKEISEKSERLDVKFHYDGGILPSNKLAAAIMSGQVSMGSTGLTQIDKVAPLTANTGISFTSDNAEHLTHFIYTLYNENKEIQEDINKIGKVLNMWGADRAAFFSTIGPILSPDDLKGKRVLVWSTKQLAQIKEWGGIPIQILPADTYLALYRGFGDVFLGPIPTGTSMKLMELAKDITPINAFTEILFTWIDWNLWNNLSYTEQELIIETTKNWGHDLGKELVATTEKDIVIMKSKNCRFHTLSEAQYSAFLEPVKRVIKLHITEDFERNNIDKDPEEWIQYLLKISERTKTYAQK